MKIRLWKAGYQTQHVSFDIKDAGKEYKFVLVKSPEKALPKVRVLRGVDLEKLVMAKAPEPKMEEKLKWMPGSQKPPKSTPGSNIIVTFQNKSKQKIKLFWVEYSGGLKLYGEIDPGAERKQNTYSGAYWVVTDLNDQQLGHFLTGQKYATAVIP